MMLTKFSPLNSGSDLGNEPWPEDDSDEEIENVTQTPKSTKEGTRRFIRALKYI